MLGVSECERRRVRVEKNFESFQWLLTHTILTSQNLDWQGVFCMAITLYWSGSFSCHVSTTVSFKFWIHESHMIRGTRSVIECTRVYSTHTAIFHSPPHVVQVECFFTKQIFDLCLEAEKSDRNKKDSPDRHRGVQVFRLWLVVYSIQSSKGLTLPDWVSPWHITQRRFLPGCCFVKRG